MNTHTLPIYSREKCTMRSPLATAIRSPTGDIEMWHSCNQHCNSISSFSPSCTSSFQPQSKSSQSPTLSANAPHSVHVQFLWEKSRARTNYYHKSVLLNTNYTLHQLCWQNWYLNVRIFVGAKSKNNVSFWLGCQDLLTYITAKCPLFLQVLPRFYDCWFIYNFPSCCVPLTSPFFTNYKHGQVADRLVTVVQVIFWTLGSCSM